MVIASLAKASARRGVASGAKKRASKVTIISKARKKRRKGINRLLSIYRRAGRFLSGDKVYTVVLLYPIQMILYTRCPKMAVLLMPHALFVCTDRPFFSETLPVFVLTRYDEAG